MSVKSLAAITMNVKQAMSWPMSRKILALSSQTMKAKFIAYSTSLSKNKEIVNNKLSKSNSRSLRKTLITNWLTSLSCAMKMTSTTQTSWYVVTTWSGKSPRRAPLSMSTSWLINSDASMLIWFKRRMLMITSYLTRSSLRSIWGIPCVPTWIYVLHQYQLIYHREHKVRWIIQRRVQWIRACYRSQSLTEYWFLT